MVSVFCLITVQHDLQKTVLNSSEAYSLNLLKKSFEASCDIYIFAIIDFLVDLCHLTNFALSGNFSDPNHVL